MTFDFDTLIDRRHMPGEKWGRYAGRDIIPMWVADMDFASPPVILDALRKRLDHPVLGYTEAWPSLVDAVLQGLERDHGWRIEPDWLVWLPGMVCGFNLACRAMTEPGCAVFTATPVYPPFLSAPRNQGKRLISCNLQIHEGRWQWDRAATETIIGPETRLFMLCNPHNPVGRVFDEEELNWIAGLAKRHDLIICSDEIHCGLVLDEATTHRPIASLDSDTAARTITLMAPSKTWNIPGLYCTFAIIPNPKLRKRYTDAMRGIVSHPNLLGLVATEAAYRDGDSWRQALIAYLRGNLDLVMEAVAGWPKVSAIRPEATYLVWMDCRSLGMDDPAEFFERAGVGLSDGAPFGMPGFVRLNFGCPRSLLKRGLDRITTALRHLQ